ncbi:hypothetical protein IV102_14985 [bacterium]|nr:hypothetical protein [bacterium]
MDVIDDFSSEGEFHSSGTFTLSVAESRARLSQFQMESGLFLTKWVQAGVALNSQKIRLDVSDRLTATLMGVGNCKLKVDALLGHLQSPWELVPSSPEASLVLGILASQAQGPSPLTVHLKDPDGGLLIQVLAGEARAHRTPSSGLDWSLQISLSGASGCDFRSILQQRCGYCPVPIELGNEVMESPWDNPGEEEYRVAEAFLESDGPARLLLPDPATRASWCVLENGHYSARNSADPRAFLLCYPGGRRCGWDGALAVSADLQGPSRLLWVKGGVIIEEEQVDLGTPGMLGVVSAHYLQTDLSQFKLRRDEAYQARLALLREQSDQLLRRVFDCPLPVRVPARAGKSVEEWIQQRAQG